MPRSSFSHNPLLRVSRPVSACSRCRAAKVKCDGKLPACTACEKAGRENECSSANDEFARGKERSYVAALELRIEKLEKRLEYAKSRKASVAFHDPDPTSIVPQPDRRNSFEAIRAAIHRKAARDREAADVNSLVSDFSFLSVNVTGRDFSHAATDLTFARMVLVASTNNSLPDTAQNRLPPRQDAQMAFQCYMTHVQSLFPSFSETSLLTALDDIYQQDGRAIRDSDYWMVYMVLAIGSATRSNRFRDEHYNRGVEFASFAMKHADGALGSGDATRIQSLLLLTQYSMLDPAHFDSWQLIGFTAQASVDLGFHQEPLPWNVSDKSVLDMRRKLFYCVYALDRAISMIYTLPFSFTDNSIHVAFPSISSLTPKASIAGPKARSPSTPPAILLFQLRRAQSFWYQELHQSGSTPLKDPISFVWQMCQDMREWADSLPVDLEPATRRLFDQELRYSYVYCVAPSARVPQISDYSRILIFEHSVAYLETSQAIAFSPGEPSFFTYHDVLKFNFMANQLLAVLRDAEEILLSEIPVPIPLSRPGSAPAPPIPRRLPMGQQESRLDRSLRCLHGINQTLTQFSDRWEDSRIWKGNYARISEEVVLRLRTRKQMMETAMAQQQPNNMRWVPQMMSGGPPFSQYGGPPLPQ